MLLQIQFVVDSGPSWVEIGGFVLSVFGTIAAVLAAVKLFQKNKDMEKAIVKLSEISTHYGDMLDVERKTRLRNIRPYFHIKKFSFTNREKPSCTLTVMNLGETGFGMTIGQLNEKNFYIGTLSVHVMTKGGECQLELSKVQDFKLPFVASFHDIDGNFYQQYFTADGLAYKPNTPTLIRLATEGEVHKEEMKKRHTPPVMLSTESTFEHPGSIKS